MATKRNMIIMARPPKPIGQMTPEERRAFAAELGDAMVKGANPSNKSADVKHGWEHVEEGERTKKGDVDVHGGGHSVAGVIRDGKRYGVGVGRDDDGVFVHTHRARSKSYPDMDSIPTKDLEFVDSTG